MKVYIITFGCKVNQYDSEAVLELLIRSGFTQAENVSNADIVILNSCAVTSESVRKLKKTVNYIKSNNPKCITVLMGCIPQAFPGMDEEFSAFDITIGNYNKANLVSYISEFTDKKEHIVDIIPRSIDFDDLSIEKFSAHTRAFLKIEDGCNRFCSYCIIPYARGRVRSKSIDDIKREVENLVKNGYKEIILVGINLSSYGTDLGLSLYDAINAAHSIDGVQRIRLGSLEPDLIQEDFLNKLSKKEKFCHHFHLSLQSGSNKVLKSMRRLYTREEYINTVRHIRRMFEDATITTDIIVGFPGESESDFLDSIDIIKEVNFLKVHIFPYSERRGTLASKMPDKISNQIKSLRVRLMKKEVSKQTSKVLHSFTGETLSVLYEKIDNEGFYEGYSDNYILVKTKSDTDIRGKIVKTHIKSNTETYCVGIIE